MTLLMAQSICNGQFILMAFAFVCLAGCEDGHASAQQTIIDTVVDTTYVITDTVYVDTLQKPGASLVYKSQVNTGSVNPVDLVNYAKTLIGVPYKYASVNPAVGFDCSGFITYVFNHFNIAVPRSSIDFTNVGKEVPYTSAQPGDLILFTGTDSTIRQVGHMGIVVDNSNGQLNFIHSTSGKKYGVTITPLETYYKGRFVKTIRLFPANDLKP